MLGTLWLVVRARSSVRAGALAIGGAGRLPVVTVVDADHAGAHDAAVVPAAADADACCWSPPGCSASWRPPMALAAAQPGRASPVAGAIGLAAAIAFSQDIPDVLRPDLTIAYTDTDGHGQRGDRRPPSSEKYYSADRRRHPARHRQAARSDRGADRRLQLPVVLPLLGLSGVDLALRQPAGAVRPAGRTDREVVQVQDAPTN